MYNSLISAQTFSYIKLTLLQYGSGISTNSFGSGLTDVSVIYFNRMEQAVSLKHDLYNTN